MKNRTDLMENEAMYRGKIGRLPRAIRVDLSQRMEEGHATRELLDWLNHLPKVGWCIVEYFNGEPINAQNLSNWRRGGHQHWLKHEERRALIRELAAEGAELAKEAGSRATGDHLSAVLMAEFAVAAQATLAAMTDPAERCKRLEGLLGTLIKVRRQDCASARRAREAATEQELEEFQAECKKDWAKVAHLAENVPWGWINRNPSIPDDASPELKAVVAQFRQPAKPPAPIAKAEVLPDGPGAKIEDEDEDEDEDEKKSRVRAKQPESRLIKVNQGCMKAKKSRTRDEEDGGGSK
jgi:hypothetical protein